MKTFNYKKVKYGITGEDTVSVLENKTFSGNLVIPETIEKDGKNWRVTTMNPRAFAWSEVTSVSIPGSVKTVPYDAFFNCKGLKKVLLADGVSAIEDDAFAGCPELEEISMPAGIEVTGANPFAGTKWFSDRFAGETFCILGGSLFAYQPQKPDPKVIIPDGVRRLNAQLFYENREIVSVVIPEGVTDIGPSCFNHCTDLKSVILPSGIKRIPHACFRECESLMEITLPQGVQVIDRYAFQRCSSLERVSLPDTLEEIEFQAFAECNRLRDITIPSSIGYIEEEAFANCTSLTDVGPFKAKSVFPRAFKGCSNLGKKVLKVRESATMRYVSDPFMCHFFCNLSEDDVKKYSQPEYVDPEDEKYVDREFFFIPRGCLRSMELDGKEFKMGRLYALNCAGNQEMEKFLASVPAGSILMMDAVQLYKYITVFEIGLDGVPFSKNLFSMAYYTLSPFTARLPKESFLMRYYDSSSYNRFCCDNVVYNRKTVVGRDDGIMEPQGKIYRNILRKDGQGGFELIESLVF